MMLYLIPFFGTLITVVAFDIEVYTANFSAYATFMFLHGLAVAPFAYVCSCMFFSRATAQNVVMMLSGFVPIIIGIIFNVLQGSENRNLNKLAKPIKYVVSNSHDRAGVD